jgi:AraC-like DNA-binding protein
MSDMRQTIGRLDAVHPDRAGFGLCVATLRPTGGCMDRERESPLLRADFHVVLLCSGGSADHVVDLSIHHHEPGSLLWIRPGQVHERPPVIEGTAVCFTDDFLGGGTPAAVGSSSWNLGSADLRDVQAHLAVLQDEYRRHVFGPTSGRLATGEPMLRHLLLALLMRIDQVPPLDEIRPLRPHPVARAFVEMVERCFRSIHTAEEYAAVLGYSPRTIARASVEATGLTPKQVIDARLVLEAKRLLAYTDLSVCAVGHRLGFDDAANFCHFFARATGMSPGTFRASRSS